MTTRPRLPLFDPSACADAARLLVGDAVTELRALEATCSSDRYPGTYSGYFNNPRLLAASLPLLHTAKGIYLTVNPLNPALLARAENRLRRAPKGESTSDMDITARRWLLVDADPVRPTGISSSDAEHDAALARCQSIAASMAAHAWPAPVVADSGNGGHLLYRIDLPADDGGLTARCLAVMAAGFDDDVVKVDVKVGNAARIWKLYGTLTCKGDSTADRPHRMSRLLDVPADLQVVPVALLEALAGQAAPALAAQQHRHSDGYGVDLERFIARHLPHAKGPEPWSGRGGPGECWTLNPCPWNPEHTNDSAFVIRHSRGGLSAGCHHNGCAGRGWRDLRALFEPLPTPRPGAAPDDDSIPPTPRKQRKQRDTTAAAADAGDAPVGGIALGELDPDSKRLVLSAERTLPTALAYFRQFHKHTEGPTLIAHTDTLLQWNGRAYIEVEDAAMKNHLQNWLHQALRYDKNLALVPFPANPRTVSSALETIRAHAHVDAATALPCWRPGSLVARPDPCNLLAFPAGILDLGTMQVLPPTPQFLTRNAITFDYSPSAPAPEGWIAFLEQIWGDDIESCNLLQEWMGYCLTADTSQQKIMLMVGPKRSGKGTIARVLTRLLGAINVVWPSTSGLAGQFGLQSLIGKSLAIIGDARFTGEGIQTVVERLLNISGEDDVTIERKHTSSVTLRLGTRFFIISNEPPSFRDSSGALASRFLILQTTQSYIDHENHGLSQQLYRELPGILNWSLDGLQRLRQRGRFFMPEAGARQQQEIEDLSSPVGAFVRECCVTGEGLRVDTDVLYSHWKGWCEQEGRNYVGTKQMFGRDLTTAISGISRHRGSFNVPFYLGLTLKTAVKAPAPGDEQ